MAEPIAPRTIKNLLDSDDIFPAMLLLDVRRKPAFSAAPDRIAGSSWRDPSEVGEWAEELPQNAFIIVYCVHGHEVSQGVTTRLNERGYKALYLEGGIEGWRGAGGEIEPRTL